MTSKHPIVFTTAYQQYALQGYELDVVDYLVKPIAFERFLRAVNKAADLIQAKRTNEAAEGQGYFFVKVNYTMEKIFYDEVLYIEALQNYIAIHLADRKLVSYMTISNMMKQLPRALFMRIHKSYIVALQKIDSINGNRVDVRSHSLPVSRNLKETFLQTVGDRFIKRQTINGN